MSAVLLTWAALGVILVGLGLLLRRCFTLPPVKPEHFFHSFWLGWLSLLVCLQLWHLFLPVDGRALAGVAVLGALGWMLSRPHMRQIVPEQGVHRSILLALWLLTAAMLANQAVGPPLNYDSGLYHLSSVRWTASYPIVPGLGNLHGRLAYNNSYFLYVALLDTGLWADRSHHLANGLLLLVLLAQIILCGFRLFRQRGQWQIHQLFYLLSLAPVLREALGTNLSSPSPDLPIFVLGLVLSAELLALLANPQATAKEAGYAVFSITALAVVGTTVKLSFVFFGGSALLLALLVWYAKYNIGPGIRPKTILAWVGISTALAIFPWMLRGVILSGYPAYPSTFGACPVEWRMPPESLVDEANWIRSWARNPGVEWKQVLANWDWLRPWASRTLTWESGVLSPLGLVVIASLLALTSRILRRGPPAASRTPRLALLPPIAALIAWFLTAPDVRFAGSYFWVLGSAALSLALAGTGLLKRNTAVYCALGLSLALAVRPLSGASLLGPGRDHGFHPTPGVELRQYQTRYGLTLYVPARGDQCWDAPLPCTPYPNADLCLRRAGDIGHGFRLR